MNASRLVVAVCGGRRIPCGERYRSAAQLAEDTGKDLALAGRFDIVFGACPGYADVLVRSFLAARLEGSRVIGLSMWENQSEHIETGDPFYEGVEYRFLGRHRSHDIIASSDAAVFFPGSVGTKNEFSIAMISVRHPVFIGCPTFEHEQREWMKRGLTEEQRNGASVEGFRTSKELLSLLLLLTPIEKPEWYQF